MNNTMTNAAKKIDLKLSERRRMAMKAATDLIRQGYSIAEVSAVIWTDDHVQSELKNWFKDWNERN